MTSITGAYRHLSAFKLAEKDPNHMGRERVFSEKKSPITSVKLFGMEKVSGITKKIQNRDIAGF